MQDDLTTLSAVNAAEAIRQGRLYSEAIVSQCLERIKQTDEQIQAWAWIDEKSALERAREADWIRKSGRATGALHGVPVGLKDIIDTKNMPTECGTQIFKGRMPEQDARIVENLYNAGAVILGKTRTTEFAYLHPTTTTNPHDVNRSPAGSSSGSAAAVAAHHVPLAIGSQTGGSVIRPASFCGTFGFKPSRGVISRTGVLQTSETLDHIGVFANTLEDIALLSDVIASYDQTDFASFARPRPAMFTGVRSDPLVTPIFCWFDFPHHDRLSKDTLEGIEEMLDILGGTVERFSVSPQLSALSNVHKVIYDYELSRLFQNQLRQNADRLSVEISDAVERGLAISDAQYNDAMNVEKSAEMFFKAHFHDYDAIIAPAANGEAVPLSDGHTGDASHCVVWTLAGLPCITLPLMVGAHNLPIGLQLIGAIEQDDRLLRTANWMQNYIAAKIAEEV